MAFTLAEVRYGIEKLDAGRRKELFKSTAEEIFAAICGTHEAILATRNVKDLQDTGIEIIDPSQQN